MKHKVLLKQDRENRIYIAGPMTGYPNYNFEAFNRIALDYFNSGWDVENPAEHGVIDGATWEDYMMFDLTRLGLCGTIYMLDGWRESKGACIEHALAMTLGMDIVYQVED